MEDIGKIDWVHKIVNEAIINIKFITNHHKNQALFREFSSKENNLELLRLGDIRFETNFIMLERLQKIKILVQQMIVSSEWKNWMCLGEKKDVECAFFSNQFWKLLTLIVKVTEPIFNLMRLVDWKTNNWNIL